MTSIRTTAASALRMVERSDLLKQSAFIGGEWISPDPGKQLEILNPANGEVLGVVPNLGRAETTEAIKFAQEALKPWRKKTSNERADILLNWYRLVMENKEALAALMTLEQGRPLASARGEIEYAATFVRWFAEECRRVYGDIIPQPQADTRTMVLKEPIGVCAAITPWNMPAAMVTRKVAPALASGCTVILKPAEETPFCALALAALADKAGVPPGVLNLVTGDPDPIGKELTTNPTVRKVTFTGSTEVGRKLLHQCADTVKKVSLELGGNSPFIVFDDADIEAAVDGLVQSKFRNSGQTCVCANRVFIQEGIYDEFVRLFTERARNLKVGCGFDDEVQQGPLINPGAIGKIEAHIADAVAHGANLLLGGQRHKLGGNFFEPTVLSDIAPSMRISKEEIFGPVAPLSRFRTEEEVLQRANDTEYGLAAYIYTTNLGRSVRMTEELDVGVVGINKGVFATEVAPFGGRKQSGIGMEGSKYGIEEYLELKRVTVGGVD